jgi:hypothetical protein
MTASVSGFSIIQGFTSTLDTMLPSAWTSSQPQLVGLWAQRMGKCKYLCTDDNSNSKLAIVMAITLFVRIYHPQKLIVPLNIR